MALLDNGTQINTIMPEFVENHSLDVGPLSDLIGGGVICIGLRNVLTQPMGYVIIQVQVDRVQGYDEDQIALVIPDLSNLCGMGPFDPGNPMMNHVVNVIREERDRCPGNPLGQCPSSLSPGSKVRYHCNISKLISIIMLICYVYYAYAMLLMLFTCA